MMASLFQEQLPAACLQQVHHRLDSWHFNFASVAPILGLKGCLLHYVTYQSSDSHSYVLGGQCQARHHVCYCSSYKLVMGTCLFLSGCYGVLAVLAPKACYGLQAVMASLILLLWTQVLVCVHACRSTRHLWYVCLLDLSLLLWNLSLCCSCTTHGGGGHLSS